MSEEVDPNYEIKIEKAISEKYGEETVQHPSKNWDEEKERDYLEQPNKNNHWWMAGGVVAGIGLTLGTLFAASEIIK